MNTSLNIVFYGTYNHFRDDTDPASQDYWSDAISYNRQLNESYFGKMHKYRLEWELPAHPDESNNYTESYGYLRWFLDEEFVLEIKGEGLNTSGTGSEISSEPMYLLLNTAISSQWGEIYGSAHNLVLYGVYISHVSHPFNFRLSIEMSYNVSMQNLQLSRRLPRNVWLLRGLLQHDG
jgi:hypothetical protein